MKTNFIKKEEGIVEEEGIAAEDFHSSPEEIFECPVVSLYVTNVTKLDTTSVNVQNHRSL